MKRLGRDDPAQPATIDDETAADFAALNVTIAGDATRRRISEERAFDVWDINWKSLNAFIACQTQWRLAVGFSRAVWLGLDYSAVDVVLRRRNLSDQVFEDLRVMEAEALRTFDEVEA